MKFRTIVMLFALLPLFACSSHGVSKYLPYASLLNDGSASNGTSHAALPVMHPENGAMALPGGGTPFCTGSTANGAVQCPVLLNSLVGIVTNVVAQLTGIYPGLRPTDIRAAYDLPSIGGAGSTVAVVDKGDDPNAESDLAVYRHAFGLPACTTANGCFRKVTETGASTGFGAGDQQWSAEIALDLDMVSAVCPNCHIVLVETNSTNIGDFGIAVDTAVRLGATEVSNSYYTSEYAAVAAENAHYDHPGVPITASSGDSGYGVMFPASSPYVIAVGGTTLSRAPGTSRGWREQVWSGTGSGCSALFDKPAWQHDSGCSRRTVGDVAAVADPATGVAVYNTYAASILQGWGEYGGTSVGAPVVAAIYALVGNASGANGASWIYAHASALNAVTSGSNGSCTPSYLCTAGAGYNGPTGLGTPNGIGAF